MDIVSRVQGILLKPKDEWVKIKEEVMPHTQLLTSYVLILAAIPAIAQFIGFGLIGFKVPFLGWYRYGVGGGLLRGILVYVFSVAYAYIFAIIVNALAPTFSSEKNMDNAMKLAAYCLTPYWVASVLYIVPFLGILVMLASLYGLYILYLGFQTPLMNTPKEKVVSYFVISIVVVIVIMVVITIVLGAIFAVGGVYRAF